jgi:hypothetical protein
VAERITTLLGRGLGGAGGSTGETVEGGLLEGRSMALALDPGWLGGKPPV